MATTTTPPTTLRPFESLLEAIPKLIPFLVALAIIVVGLWFLSWLLLQRKKTFRGESRAGRQAMMLGLSVLGILCVILTLPVEPATRQQLLGLFGLVLTAVIALASTTFAANAMAGLMLRAVRSFRPGDFVRTGDEFGRVTERGLFHTEIQTRDRDLTTVPNLYLVSNPFTVVRSSGTIVSCSLSLGYDLHHERIEKLLLEAATAAALDDPFVRVEELGDFSVTYRVAGFLTEVKNLLTARSTLRKRILSTLHDAGVEIVSPNFMNQRPLTPGTVVIPEIEREAPAPAPAGTTPEEIIFDKAEQAEQVESLRAERERLTGELKELNKSLSGAEEADKAATQLRIETHERRLAAIEAEMENADGDDEQE